MGTLSILRLFYIMYTVYTLFVMSVSDYQFIHAFFGLIAIWLVYFSFSLGYRTVKVKKPELNISLQEEKVFIFNYAKWKKSTYIFHAIMCWVCTILASRFYTGRNFIQTVTGILRGESLYASYQNYFAQNNLAAFTPQKIIYVLMLTYTTVILFYSFTSIILSKSKINVSKILFLLAVSSAYIFFGLSRGTNFEMYMIFMLLSYCILNSLPQGADKKKNIKAIAIVGVLGVILVFVFRLVLTVRGSVFRNTVCTEISFNPDSAVAIFLPTITNIGLSVFSYLGYGIYAIGVTVSDIFLGSITDAVAAMAPMGRVFLLGQSFPELLRETIDVGVRWVPDWVNFVDSLGLPLFLIFMFIFGRCTAKILNSNLPKSLVDVCCVFIFLQMISLPIGNFIFNSTPNVLAVLFTIANCMYGKLYAEISENAARDSGQ